MRTTCDCPAGLDPCGRSASIAPQFLIPPDTTGIQPLHSSKGMPSTNLAAARAALTWSTHLRVRSHVDCVECRHGEPGFAIGLATCSACDHASAGGLAS